MMPVVVGQFPVLAADEVHVWCVDEGVAEQTTVEHRPGWLGQADVSLRRAVLCQILGGYLGLSPEAVRLVRAAQGKLFLPDHAELQFSLAHSGPFLLVAITRGSCIGVDVERTTPDDLQDVAALHFAETERARLAGLHGEEYTRAWFALWTLKEAYAKWLGSGLTETIMQADILSMLGSQSNLWFENFEPRPGWMAAVVYEGSPRRMSRFDGSWLNQV